MAVRYLRALAAFYVRLTFDPPEVYKTLEPFLSDYRKLKRRTRTGFSPTHIDQFVDDLLTKDRVCATSLWKLPSRQQLEDLDLLEERVSPLAEELDELDADEDAREENGAHDEIGRESSVEEGKINGNSRDDDDDNASSD